MISNVTAHVGSDAIRRYNGKMSAQIASNSNLRVLIGAVDYGVWYDDLNHVLWLGAKDEMLPDGAACIEIEREDILACLQEMANGVVEVLAGGLLRDDD